MGQTKFVYDGNKIAVLIALGPDKGVEVPCRFFPNMESGKRECDKIFGRNGEVHSDGVARVRYPLYTSWRTTAEIYKIANNLFTSYYDGWGEAWVFLLKEIEFNTKFVSFDLG